MAQTHLNTSSVHLGGIDLSGYVKDVAAIDLDPWQQRMLDRLPTGRITISGYWNGRDATRRYYDALMRTWQAWHDRRKQRLSRMHAAYRRRRR